MNDEELIAKGYNLDCVEWEMYEEEYIKQSINYRGPDIIHRRDPLGDSFIHTYASSLYLTRLLLSYGANVNEIGFNNMTPLMDSILSTHVNTRAVQFLLDSGADPNIINNHGMSACDYALSVYEEDRDITMLFLRRNLITPLTSINMPELWKYVYLYLFCVPLCVPRTHKLYWLNLDCIRLLGTFL